MALEIVSVVTTAVWALGVQLLVGRLLVGLVTFLPLAPRRRARWRAASRRLGRVVYGALAALVAAGLTAHLVRGVELQVAPALAFHAAFWVVPASIGTAGAALLALAAQLQARGTRRGVRALTWRGGLLLALGGFGCGAVAAGGAPLVMAPAPCLAGGVGLLCAGSGKALPGGRIAALLWVAAALATAALSS